MMKMNSIEPLGSGQFQINFKILLSVLQYNIFVKRFFKKKKILKRISILNFIMTFLFIFYIQSIVAYTNLTEVQICPIFIATV